MNKKLLAVAVAAALAAPLAANADSGNVKISGSLHVSVDSLDNGNTRNVNASSNSSRIVFEGDESLGNGLKAVWQLTSFVGMGATGPNDNLLSNGNSYLGLSGGFGTAIVGRHDTPVKMIGRKVEMFGDQIGDSRNLISDSKNSAGWDLRPDNVVAYISPTMGGVTGIVAYVTNVGGGAAADNSITAWSGSVGYEAGPAMVAAGYEKHNLSKATAGANDEKIWRLVGGYSFGDAKVTGLYQKESDILGSSNGRKVWGLGAGYKMGATTLKGQYYKANSIDNNDQTGAKMFALGADYSLSKRTTAYAVYAKTSNDTGASFSAFGGGHGDNPGVAAGKNGSGISFGMKHSF